MSEHINETSLAEGIRLAEAPDVAAIARLFVQLGYRNDPDRLAVDLTAREPGRQVLVSADRHGVTGVLVLHLLRPLHLASGWALISALVVDEAVRGQGRGVPCWRQPNGWPERLVAVKLNSPAACTVNGPITSISSRIIGKSPSVLSNPCYHNEIPMKVSRY